MAVSGSMFTFSVFADSLRKRFGFSSSDINIISGSGNTALYLSFLAIGPIYDVLGATATMAIAAVSYSLGYALIWAAYQGVMPGTSVGAVAVFYFIAGFGATAGYMAVIGINVINFPPKLTGLTTGVLLLFYGLSGTIYAQVIPTSMTPLQILVSGHFWMYSMTCIWQQGLTYTTNVSTILASASGRGATAERLAQTGALHVTMISIGQSVGRFSFGFLSDVIVACLGRDRTLLLIVGHAILLVPHAIVAFAGDALGGVSSGLLLFCSGCIGLGMGACGALFPMITKDLFGSAYYGTACAFELMGVPLGIMVSNLVFGYLYDAALRAQPAGGDAAICYGSACFAPAFVVGFAIQLVPLCVSVALFMSRTREAAMRQRTVRPAASGEDRDLVDTASHQHEAQALADGA
ncbi:hypothetical protein HK105_204655 [Polyrhizophydium stewartii]|uniref:Nodulin-like domain-containing protein n=1 Tax=Polyrhizophydium stewartii TaxID=2732419 RepID=A0ABR4N8C2_9FUNG